MHIWLNGRVLDTKHARVPAHNAGTLLGWGVFTTLGIWSGRPFALVQHLQRLRHNASELILDLAFTDYELDCALYDVIEANNVMEGVARLTVTARGDGRWSSEPGSDVSVLVQKHGESYTPFRPLALGVSSFRVPAGGALQGIKSTSYASHLRAWQIAQSQGFDDALLLTSDGIICEASRANIFWVKGDVVYTPGLECGALPGIARELVRGWCRQHKIATHEVFQPLEAISQATEVFTTASTTGPRPVESVSYEDKPLSFGAPGTVTQQLMMLWHEAVSSTQRS